MLTHASLFSGIGGFDLAAEWAGWENIFHCEWNPFGQKVLAHHFPNSKSYHDITKTDFSIHEGSIDVLTGGFPCQPYSTAGKRLGKADERHLFPHMLRCIKEVKPRWVVGENVRGLVNWNGGLVFNEVYDDLEREGYEVQSFLIPAAGVNAPHQRYRIWFVAYSNNYGTSTRFGQVQRENGEISEWNKDAKFSDSSIFNASYSDLYGQREKRRYDCSSQNVNGSKKEEFWATNSKDINGCNSYRNIEKQQEVSTRVSIKGNDEEDKITITNGVCRMDKNDWESKTSIGENKLEVDKSRTLVQDGQSRFQLSNNRGLEFIKNSLSSTNGFRLHDDISRVNRMEGKVINSDTSRVHEQHNSAESVKQEQFSRTSFERRDFSRFPIKSAVCGRNDGIPRELDSITFSKWRNESIKAYGNAIVPQVAYQIFKAINEFELLVNK